jgi:hypothetical protein
MPARSRYSVAGGRNSKHDAHTDFVASVIIRVIRIIRRDFSVQKFGLPRRNPQARNSHTFANKYLDSIMRA